MASKLQYDLVYKKICRFCAYQERSIFEIKNKLSKNIKESSIIDEFINDLMDQNFLNEERFIESYISGKATIKGWGEYKIRNGLKAHQINENKISASLSKHFSDRNLLKLKELIVKKRGQLSSETDFMKKKAKLVRYCLSKGFSLTDILANLDLDS